MIWQQHAHRLADTVTHPVSRWRQPVATTPRHTLVPTWWEPAGDGAWTLRRATDDFKAPYADDTLVTKIGPHHADQARPGDTVTGRPTSSSTLPSLVLKMYRHGMLYDGASLLDVATGSGYGTALASRRLGAEHVTSIDVDPYLTDAARDRLASIGLQPTVAEVDATGPLPGTYDRIVSMVSVRPIPASWLAALRPGGRLVTTIANMTIIITADATPDGGAVGKVERDWAGFMQTRHGDDYPPGLTGPVAHAWKADGDKVTTGRFPVLDVRDAWDVRSVFEVEVPGVHIDFAREGDTRTAVLVHADGSWARATAHRYAAPTVHESGPRRLWSALEMIRLRLNAEGALPLYGAHVRITPDGVCHLKRGGWTGTID